MAKVVLVCPFCQTKLETADANVGRDGQCPACEKIFEIAPPARPASVGSAGSYAAGQESEYEDTGALAAIGAVAAALLLLGASVFVRWVDAYGELSDFAPGEKMALLAGTLACLAFLAVSLMGRKSLMPAVIVSGAWATVSVIWSWGVWFCVNRAATAASNVQVQEAIRSQMRLKGGLFFTLAAGVLVLGATLYAYMQCKHQSTFERLGVSFVVTQLLAVILGLSIVGAHVRPYVLQRAAARERAAAAADQPPTASGPKPAAQEPAPEPAPAEGARGAAPGERQPPPARGRGRSGRQTQPQPEPQPQPQPEPDIQEDLGGVR